MLNHISTAIYGKENELLNERGESGKIIGHEWFANGCDERVFISNLKVIVTNKINNRRKGKVEAAG